ncbi:hypothetical protein MPTK1_1g27210 [Marchantia polymorpha subsp. ruderalis]|uniref:Uncharacterized protein n=2 Tax=Marchantia polymorpha TaxID=3197 RepID=A0A176VYT8_MARPO|nr:hypothetical protein AXG93_1712s1290 [Marchantia polymorpha subsp. ruderalis]PTQ49684.1 hypothetical protein MARPO_0002s0157 [Marchantia polymorpha]BBN00200.1 hypothetical protein Mp_1g27210 [Marchantia polymorpha subsp. ruderalis]|eukprot:PTQ49684.1 hypothetical protein MARPO_0002s0157 [Marchantia polymorpha]
MVSNWSNISRKKSEIFTPIPVSNVQPLQTCNPGVCQIVLLAISLALLSTTIILFQTLDLRHLQNSCFSEISTKLFSGTANLSSSSTLDASSPIIDALNTSLSDARDETIFGTEAEHYRDVPVRDKAWYLEQLTENGTRACHEIATASAQVFFGPDLVLPTGDLKLQTDRDYEVVIVSYSSNGSRRCSGGDFFEIDLNGTQWKSRPPIKDLGDGTYVVNLRVDGAFAGVYGFRVILLFPNWHGMELTAEEWVLARDIVYLELEFAKPEGSAPVPVPEEELRRCDPAEDYKRKNWEGRWTRSKFNETCRANEKGRFLCLDRNQTCDDGRCDGEVGRLESNGWVYSAHCAFRIFSRDEAWDCVSGKWLFFWGDSNHQDTIRNLLNFPLGLYTGSPYRNGHSTHTNPRNASQSVTVTNSFNGHYVSTGNNLGLESLDHSEHRENVTAYFNGTVRAAPPDAVIMNSGLHDGNNWPDVARFERAARNASEFWKGLWASVAAKPTMVYRTTVAPAGFNDRLPARNTKSNVQKHEVFNAVMVDTFVAQFGRDNLRIVDSYDMTFPWHYDHLCSDGPHYGRSPSSSSWVPGGHRYFVDIMLTHVLLNAICPAK